MQLNFYGLMVGLAVVAAWQITEKLSHKFGLSPKVFNRASVWFGVGAVVGARLWHVLTSADLYFAHPELIIQVQNGGMSIWGVIWGGVLSLTIYWWINWFSCRKDLPINKPKNRFSAKQFWLFLDSLSFGLPIAQAIGRLGNWFNQELYGLPSNLPWAITIDRVHRLPGYEEIARYHPLFSYEIIALIILWALLWRQPEQSPPGRRFVFYLFGYTLIRFCLDFIRIDQLMLPFTQLSVNQVVSVILLFTFISLRKFLAKKMQEFHGHALIDLIVGAAVGWGSFVCLDLIIG